MRFNSSIGSINPHLNPHRLYPIVIVIVFFITRAALAIANVDFATGVWLFELDHYDRSRAFFEKVINRQPKHAAAHYYLGRTYFELGDVDNAVKYTKRAVELRPTQADYHFWLGRCYGAKAAQAPVVMQAFLAPKVRKAFERTVKLDPNHVSGRIALTNFYLRAPRVMGGHIDKAYAQAKKLVELDEVKGKLLLARIYEKDHKIEAAESEYQYLEQQYGTSSAYHEIYEDYGQFLLTYKRYDEAIEKFTRQAELISDKSDLSKAYDRLGDAYRASGRLSKAAEAYREALQFDPYLTAAQRKLERIEQIEDRTNK